MKYLKQSILLLLLKQAAEVSARTLKGTNSPKGGKDAPLAIVEDDVITADDDLITIDDMGPSDDGVVSDDSIAPIIGTPSPVKGTCEDEDSLVEVSSVTNVEDSLYFSISLINVKSTNKSIHLSSSFFQPSDQTELYSHQWFGSISESW